MIKAYWWPAKNFGDTLTPIILEWVLGEKVEFAKRSDGGKLLAVGSVMIAARPNDVVWGTGSNRPGFFYNLQKTKFLAVRGPLTRKQIKGDVPEIYGDPAILLPLIYSPKIEKKHRVGIIPHYVDKPIVAERPEKIIDIQADWKTVIDEILSCDFIISSSLHGLIVAEAYGIPAAWVKLGEKIRGCEFKFNDYILGTGRKERNPDIKITGAEFLSEIENLASMQENIIMALKTWKKSI